jgi:cell division protein ZapA
MSERSIKVTIAGRIYPITVKGDEEESVRAAAKKVDDNIKHLLENYAVKDKQDLLAMTALQLSTENMEHNANKSEAMDTSVLDKIEELVDAIK